MAADTRLYPMLVNLREAALIQELRSFDYGTMEIMKEKNTIARVISRRNKLIVDKDGVIAIAEQLRNTLTISEAGAIEDVLSSLT